ncbi:MAG: haloacid dehalogenase type II [Rhodospirillales bacterium]|nr:haloacid dehalogenase type II [Rhodospirillales bacterium]
MIGNEIKALTFDVLGTVVAHRDSLIREGRKLGRDKGIDVDWETFADRWREHQGSTLDEKRKAGTGWTKSFVLYRRSLEHVLAEFGITSLSPAEIDEFNRTWERLDPWPDSVAGLTRMKKKFIIAAMSNANISMIINGAKHARLPWDAVLGSEIAKHYKPHPDVYRMAADFLGVAPQECMMVAAHNYDLIGAQDCGYRAAFIDRGSPAHGAGDTEDLEPTGDFDLVAKDLLDLADKLGC